MKKSNIVPTGVSKSALLLCILLLPLILVAPTSQAAENGAPWIAFVPGATPETRLQILPKSADTKGICVDSSFYGLYNIETTIDGVTYNRLHMPGAGYATALGKPAVPVVTRFLEIPDAVNVSLTILYRETKVLEGFNLIPAQEYPVDYPNATAPSFAKDETTYATNAFYPSDPATLEGASGLTPIMMRGHRLAPLNLYPVQFNPVTHQLSVCSKLEVRLDYDEAGQVGPIDLRLDSPAFEALLERFVLNYGVRGIANFTKGEDAAEYLIITHDDFYREASDLADWKQQKGLRTKVVNTTQIAAAGPTADEIAEYIQTAYETWQVAPSYVLLLGDSEFIPTHYDTPHPHPVHGPHNISTDLYYGTVDGADYFPDIYVGRLSVDTAQEADIVVTKILNYEQNPPTDAAFYTHAVACAYFQDERHQECYNWYNVDGYEDRAFILTSEEIRDYLISQGYTVDRVYTTAAGVNPQNYSRCWFDNGDPLPADLLIANGFAWNGATADITDNINAGSFLVYHRDHGSSTNCWRHDTIPPGWGANVEGWTDPRYETGDIAGLANDQRLPVVLSIECQGGWFDGETDQTDDPALIRSNESFCERFVRHQNGSIAAIGSTRISYSGYNDDLIKGFIDAIFPGFDPSSTPGDLYSLGQMLVYGKVYMATEYTYTGRHTQHTFELFHLFGDPELAIWTEQPRPLTASHPTHIGSNGVQKFVVNVTDQATGAPVPHAKVCLQKGTQVHKVAYTDPAGGAYFSVYATSGGVMQVTATKPNYRPYLGALTVTNGGASLSVNPNVGPPGMTINLQGSSFDNDEQVAVYFGGSTPETTVTASAGSFTETLTAPAGPVGPLNVVAIGQTSGRRAVALFRRLPDQPLPDPYSYSQWDSSTWHLNSQGGDPRWNSPSIQLYDASGNPAASNDLEVGTTYTVEATIYNDASGAAPDTTVTFEWTFWGGGQENWLFIENDTVTVPANGGQATASVSWTPPITGHCCIRTTIYHPYDENRDNNKGQENTDVHPVASPGEVAFTVSNPSANDALVYVVARQVGTLELWPTRIKRDYPQVQGPGKNRTVTLEVEAPDDADVGETRIFTVSCYIDGELIGGVEVEVVVGEDTTSWCLLLLGLVVFLISIILLLIRGRSRPAKLLGVVLIALAIIMYVLVCVLR